MQPKENFILRGNYTFTLRNPACFLFASQARLTASILPAIALSSGTLVSKMPLAVTVILPPAPELLLPAAIALDSLGSATMKPLER